MRLLAAPLALVALAACARSAAPVPVAGLPEYPPPVVVTEKPRPAQPPRPSSSLEGTTWKGPDSEGTEWSFDFLRGGSLHYVLAGAPSDNGTWKQTGANVVMETNDHYADYTGQVRGNRITGSAHNKVGKSWTWVLDRQP